MQRHEGREDRREEPTGGIPGEERVPRGVQGKGSVHRGGFANKETFQLRAGAETGTHLSHE